MIRTFSMLALLLATTVASAQFIPPGGGPGGGGSTGGPPNPDYVLSVGNGIGFNGDVVATQVTLDIAAAATEEVLGWSFSVCHDPALVTITDAQLGVDALSGGQSPTNPNGGIGGFGTVDLLPDGVASGVIRDIFGVNTLPAGTGYVLLDIDYTVIGQSGIADLDFCTPATAGAVTRNEVMFPSGNTATATTQSGEITIGINGPLYTFSLPDVTQGFDSSSGAAAFTVGVAVSEDPGSPNFPNATHGFSMSLGHDAGVLSATGAAAGAGLSALNAGAGPEFFSVNVLADGITIGAVYSLMSAAEIVLFDVAAEAASIDYATNAGALQGTINPTTTVLDWMSLGTPSVDNLVAVDFAGATVPVLRSNGSVTLVPGGPFFVRGDCSADGSYNLGDPLAILGHLFNSTGPLACDDACDGNDDGSVNLTDVVFLLENLFAGGANPPAPIGTCGADPTNDSMSCTGYGCP